MAKTSYDFNTFKELYDSHIHYSYEGHYGVHIKEPDPTGLALDAVIFHKLTIYNDGNLEYKGQWDTYNPKLWPKVLAFAEMLHETKAEKILLKK